MTSPTSPAFPTAAIIDVMAERQRQVSAEGWTPAHDDAHGDGSMADAAACYALTKPKLVRIFRLKGHEMLCGEEVPELWPETWAESWWKPKDRRRDLVRAAALILAEIELLDRMAP